MEMWPKSLPKLILLSPYETSLMAKMVAALELEFFRVYTFVALGS